jgi:hypothetical protein
MKRFFVSLVFVFGFTAVAQADVWSWVDAGGNTTR